MVKLQCAAVDFLLCLLLVNGALALPGDKVGDVSAMPATQLASAKLLQHGCARVSIKHGVARTTGGIERIQGRHTGYPFEITLGCQLQPKIPILEQGQLLIKAAGRRLAHRLQPEQHGMDRQVILELQQAPVKLTLVEMRLGWRAIAPWHDGGLNVAVASVQVRV